MVLLMPLNTLWFDEEPIHLVRHRFIQKREKKPFNLGANKNSPYIHLHMSCIV